MGAGNDALVLLLLVLVADALLAVLPNCDMFWPCRWRGWRKWRAGSTVN